MAEEKYDISTGKGLALYEMRALVGIAKSETRKKIIDGLKENNITLRCIGIIYATINSYIGNKVSPKKILKQINKNLKSFFEEIDRKDLIQEYILDDEFSKAINMPILEIPKYFEKHSKYKKYPKSTGIDIGRYVEVRYIIKNIDCQYDHLKASEEQQINEEKVSEFIDNISNVIYSTHSSQPENVILAKLSDEKNDDCNTLDTIEHALRIGYNNTIRVIVKIAVSNLKGDLTEEKKKILDKVTSQLGYVEGNYNNNEELIKYKYSKIIQKVENALSQLTDGIYNGKITVYRQELEKQKQEKLIKFRDEIKDTLAYSFMNPYFRESDILAGDDIQKYIAVITQGSIFEERLYSISDLNSFEKATNNIINQKLKELLPGEEKYIDHIFSGRASDSQSIEEAIKTELIKKIKSIYITIPFKNSRRNERNIDFLDETLKQAVADYDRINALKLFELMELVDKYKEISEKLLARQKYIKKYMSTNSKNKITTENIDRMMSEGYSCEEIIQLIDSINKTEDLSNNNTPDNIPETNTAIPLSTPLQFNQDNEKLETNSQNLINFVKAESALTEYEKNFYIININDNSANFSIGIEERIKKLQNIKNDINQYIQSKKTLIEKCNSQWQEIQQLSFDETDQEFEQLKEKMDDDLGSTYSIDELQKLFSKLKNFKTIIEQKSKQAREGLVNSCIKIYDEIKETKEYEYFKDSLDYDNIISNGTLEELKKLNKLLDSIKSRIKDDMDNKEQKSIQDIDYSRILNELENRRNKKEEQKQPDTKKTRLGGRRKYSGLPPTRPKLRQHFKEDETDQSDELEDAREKLIELLGEVSENYHKIYGFQRQNKDVEEAKNAAKSNSKEDIDKAISSMQVFKQQQRIQIRKNEEQKSRLISQYKNASDILIQYGIIAEYTPEQLYMDYGVTHDDLKSIQGEIDYLNTIIKKQNQIQRMQNRRELAYGQVKTEQTTPNYTLPNDDSRRLKGQPQKPAKTQHYPRSSFREEIVRRAQSSPVEDSYTQEKPKRDNRSNAEVAEDFRNRRNQQERIIRRIEEYKKRKNAAKFYRPGGGFAR